MALWELVFYGFGGGFGVGMNLQFLGVRLMDIGVGLCDI
jgi:hypothetical protein